MPWPTPAGRAGEQQVAGLEGDELAHVGDQVGGGEHQLRGAAGLADHAVDLAADLEVGVGTADLVGGDQPRPDRRGVLPGLALQPLERAVLPVAHRDVVGDGEPGDGVGGLGAGGAPDAACRSPARARPPSRPVRSRLAARCRRARRSRASRNLANSVGCVGELVAHLEDVAPVVQALAEDLAGEGDDRRESAVATSWTCPSPARRRRVPAARRRRGTSSSTSASPSTTRGVRAVGGPDRRPSHGAHAVTSRRGRIRAITVTPP